MPPPKPPSALGLVVPPLPAQAKPESDPPTDVGNVLLLREVVQHMRTQNGLQVDQLLKTEDVLRKVKLTTMSVIVLAVLALAVLVLAIVQQWNITNVLHEQGTALERSHALEKAVSQKLSDSSNSVVRQVEQLEQKSPKVVTDYKGGLSLSVPVTPPPVGAVTVKPARTRTTRPTPPAAPTVGMASAASAPAPAPTPTDYVLVPLNR
jgi:cell division protein FtsB